MGDIPITSASVLNCPVAMVQGGNEEGDWVKGTSSLGCATLQLAMEGPRLARWD